MAVPGTKQSLVALLSLVVSVPLVAVEPRPPETIEELISPVPAGAPNAADLYLRAAAELGKPRTWGTAVEEALREADLPPAESLLDLSARTVTLLDAPDRASLPPLLERFSQELASPPVREACALLDKAAHTKHYYVELECHLGPAMSLGHLSRLRDVCRFQTAVAATLASNGDTPGAWVCVVRQLRMAEHLRNEPTVISQLVRIAFFAHAELTAKSLAATALPPPETAHTIDRLFAQAEDSAPWVLAIHGSRVIEGEWVFRQRPEDIVTALARFTDTPAFTLTATQLANIRKAHRKGLLQFAEQMRLPYLEAKEPMAKTLEQLRSTPAIRPLDHICLLDFSACRRKVAHFRGTIRVARIALRLEARRAASGKYPATLTDLDLHDIPADQRLDPFTSRPLVYRVTPNGFLLYSLGPDETDNAGTPFGHGNREAFDIVWQAKR